MQSVSVVVGDDHHVGLDEARDEHTGDFVKIIIIEPTYSFRVPHIQIKRSDLLNLNESVDFPAFNPIAWDRRKRQMELVVAAPMRDGRTHGEIATAVEIIVGRILVVVATPDV